MIFRYFAVMISIPHKAKQFLVFTIKFLIVIGAFYFIYDQISGNSKLDWHKFQNLVVEKTAISTMLFILLFSIANRYLEILKWQNLASFIQPISVGEASKQVLGALTAGIFTPNGLGEYAGKALFFKKEQTKQVIFLNLICNGIQMILTIIFGIIGLLFIGYWQWSLGIIAIAIVLLFTSFLSKNITIKGYSIQKLLHKINEIPKRIHRKNIILGILRYIVFSHQYYVLFLVFDVDLPYLTLISSISAVYFLASSLPSFQFFRLCCKRKCCGIFLWEIGD